MCIAGDLAVLGTIAPIKRQQHAIGVAAFTALVEISVGIVEHIGDFLALLCILYRLGLSVAFAIAAGLERTVQIETFVEALAQTLFHAAVCGTRIIDAVNEDDDARQVAWYVHGAWARAVGEGDGPAAGNDTVGLIEFAHGFS